MQHPVQIFRTPQSEPRPAFAGFRAMCFLLSGLVVAILGTGCETLPKYETPATQETVFERINTQQDNVDRIRWHHHELINQHFARTRSIELYIGQKRLRGNARRQPRCWLTHSH